MEQTYSGVFSGVNNSWTTVVISLSCWNTEIDVGARSIKRQVKLVSTHFDMTKSLNNTHSPAANFLLGRFKVFSIGSFENVHVVSE